MIAESLTELIGNTPLLALKAFAPGHRILAKCEFMNPISIKDRPVREIIARAEARAELEPGDTIVEATSGNTGMALASIGNRLGYRVLIVMSEIQSLERRMTMKALGAELILTPAELGTRGAKAKLDEICAEPPSISTSASTRTRTTPPPTAPAPAPKSGRPPAARSTSSSPRSAPAAPSPARAGF